ncbi:MAG: hypothetical protein CMQ34_01175 [Gammaproteobacteria bacterium]|nr:hypothetical protein [Gammaproteobacteria bacterium]|tara:strand:+ start:1088 stop:1564 length:477 start_codon:yes stop_codon:yes gene_type:complete
MKLSKLPVLALLCCFWLSPSAALAQTSDTNDHDQAVAGAMAALDEFMVAFNGRDMQAWAATLNYPHVRFASGTVTVWQSAEEFARQATFANLEAIGWDHSHWLSREPVMVSPGKVHINTVFERFNGFNEQIGTYESLYIVTRDASGKWGTQARSSLAP